MTRSALKEYNAQDQFCHFVTELRTIPFLETITKEKVAEFTQQGKKVEQSLDATLFNARLEQAQEILETRLLDGSLPWKVQVGTYPDAQIMEEFYLLQDIVAVVVETWTAIGYENGLWPLWKTITVQPIREKRKA